MPISESDFTDPASLLSKVKSDLSLTARKTSVQILRRCPAAIHVSLLDKGLIQVIEEWLEQSISADKAELLLALLQYLKSAPITLTTLKKTRIGKIIRKVKEYGSSDEIKQLSTQIYKTWMKMVEDETKAKQKEAPQKQPEKKPAARPVAAKSLDLSSIFDNSEPVRKKPKIETTRRTSLPNIKPTVASSKPSSRAPSQDSSLEDISKENERSDDKSRKRKRVSWAPDAMLCQIKIFESDVDPKSSRSGNLRDAERDEMVAVRERQRLDMKPEIDWKALAVIKLPEAFKVKVTSKEGKAQREHELSSAGSEFATSSAQEPPIGESIGSDSYAKPIPLQAGADISTLLTSISTVIPANPNVFTPQAAYAYQQPQQPMMMYQQPNPIAYVLCANCGGYGHMITHCPFKNH